MSGDSEGLTRRTARGMGWAYGSFATGRLLVLVATAILARLLTPEEFGLVALALTVMAFLDMLRDLGLAEALVIVDEDEVEDRAETALVAMLGIGVVLAAITAAMSPLAAMFFDEPELTGLMAVLGLTFLFRAIGSSHYALAQKRMDFRARTGGELADVVVRGGASIALAVAGAGAWSLVLGYIAGSLAMTIALWVLVPWRPKWTPKREHLRQLLGFGGALTGVTIAGAVLGNVDRIIIGRALGAGPLGLYTLAARLPDLAVTNVTIVAGQVLFPAFAAVEGSALGRAYLRALHHTSVLALPVSALLAVLAEPLILVAFGDQWIEGVPIMQVFCAYALSTALSFVSGTVLKSRGRAGLLLRVSILQVALVVPAVIVAVPYGIVAMAAAHAVAAFIVVIIQFVLAARLSDTPLAALPRAFAGPLVGAGALALAAAGADAAVDGALASVLLGSLAGGLACVAALWLVDRRQVMELVGAFVPRLRPAAPSA